MGTVERLLGHLDAALAWQQRARDAVSGTTSERRKGRIFSNLGNTHHFRGEFDEAAAHHRVALAIAQNVGDKRGEGVALSNLGSAVFGSCNYRSALEHFTNALRIGGQTGDQRLIATCLSNMGSCHERIWDLDEAETNLTEALHVAETTGGKELLSPILSIRGLVRCVRGDSIGARVDLERAIDIARQANNRRVIVRSLHGLGELDRRHGTIGQAIRLFEDSIREADTLDDLKGQSEGHAGVAECLLQIGQVESARTRATIALGAAEKLGDMRAQAECLLLLSKTADQAARGYLQRSRELYLATDGSGHPCLEEVESRLRRWID